MPEADDTRESAYAERLERLSTARWKRWLDVQAPYRWNLRRLDLGHTLDLGCGIGRNLLHLGGEGVGVDHNPRSIEVARERGLVAYTPEEFAATEHAQGARFDALLCAHVVEHMHFDEALALLGRYIPRIKTAGRLVLVAPQRAGYSSDPSHVEYMDFPKLHALVAGLGLQIERSYSFPFPGFAGRVFAHNEFVVVARKP